MSPFGVSAANPMWKYFLRTRFSARGIEGRVEPRKFLERHNAGFDDEGERREPHAFLRRLALESDPCDVEVSDVGVLVLRHVRHVEPARLQARAGNALDARQRLDFDGAEFREIDLRYRGQSRVRAGAGAGDVRSLFTCAFTSS